MNQGRKLIPTVVRIAHQGKGAGDDPNIPLKLFAINSQHHFYPDDQTPSNPKHP